MQSVMAGRSNYLVATIHWWANNMEKENEKKRKWKENGKEGKENKPSYANRITTLLYSTFERVPAVFYCANLCWTGYANKNSYSYLLDGLPCNSRIWRHEDMAHQRW